MARITAILLSMLATVVFSAATFVFTTGDAEARRLGGGRSFGARPAYNTPYKQATPRAATRATAPTAAQQKNAALRESFSRRGGLMGVLGGLALGGLLGALLFGGAFEGINFLDILIFAGITFLLYRILAARRRPTPTPAPATGPQPGDETDAPGADPTPAARRFDTDLLFGRGRRPDPAAAPSLQRPSGFDEGAFLDGAERAFRVLQEAWDTGDLETLRGLTTPEMFAALEQQIHDLPPRGRTEILAARPELLEAAEEDGRWHAAVLFDAELRETDDHRGRSLPPERVREVWHFVRPAGTDRPTWYLEGIQQVSDD